MFPKHYLRLSEDFGAERDRDQRSENLSLSEDMDGGLRYGFRPSLTHCGWLYVHIGADGGCYCGRC